MRGNAFRLLVALILCADLHQAFAQGTAFTYQGRLNDGSNAANGSYDLTFALYLGSSGGSAVAGPLTNSTVGVSNGLFTVTLDFGSGVFNGDPRWLEIGVRTGTNDFTVACWMKTDSSARIEAFLGKRATCASADHTRSVCNIRRHCKSADRECFAAG